MGGNRRSARTFAAAPTVLRASARNPTPPLRGGGNLDDERAQVFFLVKLKAGGGGSMRSIETEGAGCFAAQAFGAQVGEALAVLEAHEKAAERTPAGLRREA